MPNPRLVNLPYTITSYAYQPITNNRALIYCGTHVISLQIRPLLKISNTAIFSISLQKKILFLNVNLLTPQFNLTKYSISSGIIYTFLQFTKKSLKKATKIYYFFYNFINVLSAHLICGSNVFLFKNITNRFFKLLGFLKAKPTFALYIYTRDRDTSFKKNIKKNIKKRLKKKILKLNSN
jgi:hypothetical protein